MSPAYRLSTYFSANSRQAVKDSSTASCSQAPSSRLSMERSSSAPAILAAETTMTEPT